MSLTACESEGSSRKPLGSEGNDCSVVSKGASNVGSDHHDIDEIGVSALRSQKTMLVDLTQLFNLNRIHSNPKFHEGPLDEVSQLAWDRQYHKVNSIYNQGETCSNYTGLASWPQRPISADEDDISCMLKNVRPWLPLQLQSYLDRNAPLELNVSRDGMTGLNVFAEHLELLWHQLRPLIVNGAAISVTDISMIHAYQMSKTRNFRPACPPGWQGQLTPHSTFRQYLTDEQTVKINQGCVDYTEYNASGHKCKTLRRLECHPDHAGAKIDNPVLTWLDDLEGVEFYDANGYLPCSCGVQALQVHLNSRHEIEPGFDPHSHSHKVPALHYLDEDALDRDRQRKAEDDAYFTRTGEFPRCQTIAQECTIHAVPTNNLWILVGSIENPNDALTGTNNDLPVPGFTELTTYPNGFRMPQRFCEIKYDLLPPRCRHGYLHPPFADHCMGCFPNGENHDDCAECAAHAAVPAIMQSSSAEREFEVMRAEWDRAQWQRVGKGEQDEQYCVLYEQGVAGCTLAFKDWPGAVVI
ncbi:hypothetical protein SVAN01_02589 [Stagonosporopsis vannaccii]|nr:hypothetical protein SVAN01_02589 [Stagonosporopsis vannaccii]